MSCSELLVPIEGSVRSRWGQVTGALQWN